MIFDIPYHHRKCEELALKKIFVHYTFSGRYLVVGRGEKKQDITLVRYEYNKKCISYIFTNIDHTGSKIIFMTRTFCTVTFPESKSINN